MPQTSNYRQLVQQQMLGMLGQEAAKVRPEEREEIRPDMLRPDGTRKGEGYFGVLQRPDGKVSTEISIANSDHPLLFKDGKHLDYPALVPGLTPEEKEWVLAQPEGSDFSLHPLGRSIERKAEAHAIMRLKAGKSVWKMPEDDLEEKRGTL